MIEPIISLAFSMHSNKGVYAVLLGSGVSRSAGIPTGWEVLEDLIKKVAHLYGEECAPSPESWFENKFGEKASYSKLLDAIAKTPPERNQILRGYFEADEEDREQGHKLPTPAHHAIAGLVASGHVRVIVTTNFDRLTEGALEAVSIHPTVIDMPDKIEGAMPLTHSPCTVIKLHGDYMDIRIKNTPEELMKYDGRMNKVLDRVLDEYGLVVCGWSADYDVALEDAIARCPSQRFTTYWAHKGKLGVAARKLVDLRQADTIEIEGADPFFQELAEKVSALEEFDRPHPMSVKMAVAAEKKYLEEEKYRIRLHDLVMGETGRLLGGITDKNFPTTIPVSKEALRGRINAYDALSETVLGLIATGCYFSGEHGALWAKALERVAHPSKNHTGSLNWEKLRLYPAMFLMYGGGIASVAAGNYGNLYALLAIPKIHTINRPEKLPAAVALSPDNLFDHPIMGMLTDSRTDPYALNRHLLETLRGPLAEIIHMEEDYEQHFVRFEYLYALIHADLQAKANVSDSYFSGPEGLYMAAKERRNGGVTMRAVKREAKEQGDQWPPFVAGLFDGSYQRFEKVVAGFEELQEINRWLH
jgi:hypothetical protein